MIKSEHLYYSSKVGKFSDRIEMHEYLSSNYLENERIHFLEFGVYKGQTFFIWIMNNKHAQSKFWGFDTFTGLPEDWGRWGKGSFSAHGILPQVNDDRCNLFVGLIQDTLPNEIKNISNDFRTVIHIDVDIYSATLVTLINLQSILKKGDLIIFDDFFTIVVADHEFKAFQDFLAIYKISYKPLFKCRKGHFVIEIE